MALNDGLRLVLFQMVLGFFVDSQSAQACDGQGAASQRFAVLGCEGGEECHGLADHRGRRMEGAIPIKLVSASDAVERSGRSAADLRLPALALHADPPTSPRGGDDRDSGGGPPRLREAHPTAITAMTSEQAAQLIDQTLALVHERLQDLQREALGPEQRALAAEFREWSDPAGGRIDLMICPGLAGG